jgi:transketolase
MEAEKLAGEDGRVVLLSGDIGNRLFDSFKAKFDGRFLNCGVAEANMTGMAAGLALSGMRPITYTITAFNTSRCLEQIRLDICYHDLPVIVVGVGGGLSYASLGYTHHAVEDVGMLRLLPNMTVLCPGDSLEVAAALRAAHAHDGPVFIRLGKKGEPAVHRTMPDLKIGKGLVVREGTDVCLLGVGTTLPIVVAAADLLAAQGISAEVVSFHTVKPLDEELLAAAFARYRVVSVIEEHSLIGGAGAAVAEWRADNPDGPGRLIRIALPDRIFHESGSEEHARKCLGLTPEAIAERISQAVASRSR